MKKLKKNKFILFLLPFLLVAFINRAIAQEGAVIPERLVKLRYFNDSNSLQYLILESSLKTGRKSEPLKNKVFQLYLDSNSTNNFIGKVITDKKGQAKSFLPPSLKSVWQSSAVHKFIAVSTGKGEKITGELEITKARIKIDTVSDGAARSIIVQVMKYENNAWIPANEVEMRIGVQRQGGILSAGDEETYTTDSSGTVTAELTKDSLPGNEKGYILLAAKVEDNDLFGNLSVQKSVPWGIIFKPDNAFFDQRTLWTTRFRTPIWLLFMAYSIMASVWGTIIYLIIQLFRIKKIGSYTKRI